MPHDNDEFEYYYTNEDDEVPAPPDSSPEWVWDDETGSYAWEGQTDDDTGDDFEDFSEDFDDDADADDEEYEAEDDEPEHGGESYSEDYHPGDDGGGAAPDWWEDGMPDDWWDYYGDDYEVEEFEIAIDY